MLTESIKKFLSHKKVKNPSSVVNPEKVINNLSDDSFGRVDFFDYQEDHHVGVFFGEYTLEDLIKKQAEKIRTYRQIATYPDVSSAIDIICNEIIFSYEEIPLKVNVDINNKSIEDSIHKCFDRIIQMGNIKENLFNIIRNAYIDGQCVIHCQYNEKSQKKGIQALRVVDPIGLYYDYKLKKWKYLDTYNNFSLYYTSSFQDEEYENEEIVRVDFGLYDDMVCLSYLEQAIKSANMLKSLEDLLIPLRFSRSISRRVFNVDVGNLPGKRAEEYMQKIQEKFKYKKFYNNDTGEVSNQQHITSMVEDYWFANRAGSKGTSVETLDETGNLGELNDIIYLAKKLYRALKVPSSHLDIDPDSDHTFSVDSTETTQEDLKFMMFISRIRCVYASLFKEILKRQVIACGIMSEKDWNRFEHQIEVKFSNDNLFIEKLKLEVLKGKIESWGDMKEVGGTIFSFGELIKRVFGLTDDEIDENFKNIEKEKKSGKFDIFYKLADIEIATETGMVGMTDPEGNPLDVDDLEIGIFTDDDDSSEEPNDTEDGEGTKDTEDTPGTDKGETPKQVSDYFTKYSI